MENLLIQGLDEILESVQKLKDKCQKLSDQNEKLENQLNILKVEFDQIEKENIKIKQESTEKAEKESGLLIFKSEESQSEVIAALNKEQSEKNARIKLQIDGFIEDIDQCIQIIQAKE